MSVLSPFNRRIDLGPNLLLFFSTLVDGVIILVLSLETRVDLRIIWAAVALPPHCLLSVQFDFHESQYELEVPCGVLDTSSALEQCL